MQSSKSFNFSVLIPTLFTIANFLICNNIERVDERYVTKKKQKHQIENNILVTRNPQQCFRNKKEKENDGNEKEKAVNNTLLLMSMSEGVEIGKENENNQKQERKRKAKRGKPNEGEM